VVVGADGTIRRGDPVLILQCFRVEAALHEEADCIRKRRDSSLRTPPFLDPFKQRAAEAGLDRRFWLS
jgi:hypothetical protein